LILPWCNTEMMNLHPRGDLGDVVPGSQAVLLLDEAEGYLSDAGRPRQRQHRAAATKVPRAERSGERLAIHERQLAFQSRVRQRRGLARSLLRRLENKLEAQPWTIMSLGLRDWAHQF
jgi:hypothetical protein